MGHTVCCELCHPNFSFRLQLTLLALCPEHKMGEEVAVRGLRSPLGQLRQEPPPWAWSLNLGKTVLPMPSPCSSKSWEEER